MGHRARRWGVGPADRPAGECAGCEARRPSEGSGRPRGSRRLRTAPAVCSGASTSAVVAGRNPWPSSMSITNRPRPPPSFLRPHAGGWAIRPHAPGKSAATSAGTGRVDPRTRGRGQGPRAVRAAPARPAVRGEHAPPGCARRGRPKPTGGGGRRPPQDPPSRRSPPATTAKRSPEDSGRHRLDAGAVGGSAPARELEPAAQAVSVHRLAAVRSVPADFHRGGVVRCSERRHRWAGVSGDGHETPAGTSASIARPLSRLTVAMSYALCRVIQNSGPVPK